MKININKLEILEEISRWKKEAYKGNISNSGIRDIRKRGISKSDGELANGINRGTQNILRKEAPLTTITDEKMDFNKFANSGGFSTEAMNDGSVRIGHDSNMGFFRRLSSPVQNAIQLTQKQKNSNKLKAAIALRHEAYEASDATRKQNELHRTLDSSDVDGKFIKTSKIFPSITTGAHFTGNILNRERKDLTDLSYTDASKQFSKLRNKTGEYNALKRDTGVDLNQPVTPKNVGINATRILNHERQRKDNFNSQPENNSNTGFTGGDKINYPQYYKI